MANERKSGLGSRRVRDVMTANPECVRENDGIVEAARIMKSEDAGVVPIIDNDRKLVGIITDRDIVVRLVADGRNPLDCKVNEAMTKHIRSVRDDATVDEVMST